MDGLRSGDPQRIGAYRVLGRLGAGATGVVYLARSDVGTTVAVKLIRRELAERQEFRARFRQEVRAARRVGGKWTAPVLDADTEAPAPWVATGYLPAPSLRHVVAEHGPLPERSVRVLTAGLARALRDIHSAEPAHRTLKPSTVLVTLAGPRVVDFGASRALEADGARPAAVPGSLGFSAPEQLRGGPVTAACDVFRLGAVLAYASSGEPPFGPRRDAEEAANLSGVPVQLRGLIAACLARDPEQRPTPAQVLERADAGSAAGEAWLPGAVVDQLGRYAARLAAFQNPAAKSEGPPTVPLAVIGPRHPRRGPEDAAPPTAISSVSGPTTYGTATAYLPEPPRRRRGTTALLIAVALVVAAMGGGTVYTVLRHDEEGAYQDRTAAPGPEDNAPGGPASSAKPGTESASPGGIPKEYLGTWESGAGSSGADLRRITVRQGSPGDTVFTMLVEGEGYHCEFAAELRARERKAVQSQARIVELGPSTVTKGTPGTCEPGPVTTLELTGDGSLRRTFSDGSAAPITYKRVGQAP
ncbi:serine/threonine-protein kinase [Streptomyces pathocidini]|uniref:Serine/threonine-protein kinase n=1 Tax=Streptomyces pathocidini TaxID=1650571 RepID=A0ABW7URU7_9ACTN